ncbi:MAG: dihydroxy-acid dehydratase, partial [Solirubrobacterales bacterium]
MEDRQASRGADRVGERPHHHLALARESGVDLTFDDFDRISEKTPLLCDLKPGGRFVAVDLFEAGGVPLVASRLLEAGLLHEDAPT